MVEEHRSHDQRDPPREPPESSAITDDRFYRVLASRQRRRLLIYLQDGEERSIEEIATVLTGWAASSTDSMQTAADREQIRIELFHSHLPLLDEVGLIDYDREDEVVAIDSLDPRVEELLADSVASEPPES